MTIEEVSILRNDMKEITKQIMQLVNQRMEIARKIGAIKTNLDLDIIDDKVELGIKSYLFSNPEYLNLDPEFSGRIVNMLINESIRIQKFEIKSHLDVFNAAKNLELQGFKIIHMEVGEPDFLPPVEVKNELTRIYEM